MPKETIQDPTVYGDGSTSPLAVEVAWGQNTYVQIGSVNLTKPRYSADAGFYMDLNRDLINRLIKVLRKARDQAYGSDE